jgi:hypothetical protein
MRRLEVLQWFGLLAGAAIWGTAHVVGFGVTEARCGSGGGFGIGFDTWEGLLTGIAAVVTLCAALAAATVIVLTREASYEDAPAIGRIRFFAIAALIANVLFIVMEVLYAVGTVSNVVCRQG